LYEGKYIFKVKGRNIYGFESQPAIFEFRILPPWYRTWWAYIIYILLLSVFILLLIKINARRLQKENIRLDKIVRDRTAEISMQKEEIQTQADNLEQINTQLKQRNEEISSIAENLIIANRNINDKNTYITDSINYAQRIQNAVLPSENDISEIFNDFFIIYKPKDIVGGDFYFFKKIRNHIIVAAADSTGHGVPGGFLSMMGMSFLNEIIHKNNIQSPNSALDNLRNRVKYSLHQNDYLEGRTDGIDIALCVIDTNTSIMEYSGANIPVIIIRNNELIELKPNMQPVGIHYNERPFDLKKIQLYKDDMIYLFSDGFYDQFGGKHNKKLLISNLKKLLLKNSQHPLKVQKRNISKVFNSWKGDKKQIDDIMLIGIKF
jgi:serine phosphatase RsbU (regulator of sigma subunit)